MFDFYDLTLFAAGYALLELIGILLAVDAVLRPRSSQAAIAWSISLVAFPIIGIPLYVIFGRRHFRGYTEALREKGAIVGEILEDWFSNMAAVAAEPHADLEAIERLVRSLTNIPFTRGNRVDLLMDGEETYAGMCEAIAAAESYVLVQFYIVEDDASGRRLRDALIKKSRSGIHIHFLYDEIGCLKLPTSYLRAMQDAGIEVSGFKTTQGSQNRFQINFRNHRKLLIVDGKIGFIGGHNLADDYLTYRDTHLRVEGPAALHIQFSFLKDWYWATRQIPKISKTVKTVNGDGRKVAIVNTGPADARSNCSVLFATLINTAQRRLWMTSPYFVPDDVMVRALQAAAIRGVDVRILLPGKADHRLVELASFTYYNEMLNCGVRLFRYQDRFMHQKVLLVDDLLAGVGTVNLDNRSLYLNFEATALVADAQFANRVQKMLQDDLTHCEMVDSEHFDKKPLHFRIAARIARLASPLL